MLHISCRSSSDWTPERVSDEHADLYTDVITLAKWHIYSDTNRDTNAVKLADKYASPEHSGDANAGINIQPDAIFNTYPNPESNCDTIAQCYR